MAAGSTYTPLATQTLGSAAASVTFSSISGSYTDLVLVVNQQATTANNHGIQFNGDTGANYRAHYLGGNGSVAFAGDFGASQTSANAGWVSGSTQSANVFGTIIVDILDYANTSKYKTVRSLTGSDNNGSGLVGLFSSLWMNTSAINRIDMSPAAGASWVQYSQIALYGVK
jgi:hypothetical protein